MSDWYDHEFGQIAGRHNKRHPRVEWSLFGGRNTVNLPKTDKESFDWRTQGVLQGPKHQGQCGSCWAFAAIGAIEAVTAVHAEPSPVFGYRRQALSEQQVLDCVSTHRGFSSMGCSGGFPDEAIKYAITNPIARDTDYRYQTLGPESSGDCKDTSSYSYRRHINYQYDVKANDPEALKSALIEYPVVVCADADNIHFRDYSGGIIYEPNGCTTSIGHAMVAVGFGKDPVHGDFLIIKNSWGTWWGESGYFRISMTQSFSNKGLCAILSDTTMASIKKLK